MRARSFLLLFSAAVAKGCPSAALRNILSRSAGDELIGLARGLLHAGAQSLVLSLWDVHDKSTAEYMRAFYGFLQQGKSKAEALQKAMLQLRASYPHPYQWAPFILIGKA